MFLRWHTVKLQAFLFPLRLIISLGISTVIPKTGAIFSLNAKL